MSTLTPMMISVHIEAGARVDEVIAECIEFAGKNRCLVTFEFNGQLMEVGAASDPAKILDAWGEVQRLRSKLNGVKVLSDGTIKWGDYR